jgi:murein DD-endopeptidase MepM/ murein hydrolase activator NlpD
MRLLKNAEAIKKKKNEIEKTEQDMKQNKNEQEMLEARQKELLKVTKKEKDVHKKNLKSAEHALKELERLVKKAEEVPEYAGRGLAKRVLPYPVKGEIVGRFGVEEGSVKGSKFTRKGIEINANDGASVRNVDDGKIVYSGWIRGLGNICIISHGMSFYTVYGRLAGVTRKKGEELRQGEIIGTVGKDASFYEFPTLYFEIREKDKPVNPETWLR